MNQLPAFDELSNIRLTLGAAVYEMAASRRLDRRRIEDMIFELITMGYVYGIELAGLDLEADIPVDRDRMREAAYEPTAGETFAQRIEKHVDAAETAIADNPEADADAIARLIEQLGVVAETETHRVINEGIMDAAEEYQRAHPDETLMKTWMTMMDDRVRETHDYLQGATVPLDAMFYTYDGDAAMKPGGFALPENNINCRCVLWLTKR